MGLRWDTVSSHSWKDLEKYDRTQILIKFRAFLLFSGEKDHHAAGPDCSMKHILLIMSFIIFFPSSERRGNSNFVLNWIENLLILSFMLLFEESCWPKWNKTFSFQLITVTVNTAVWSLAINLNKTLLFVPTKTVDI